MFKIKNHLSLIIYRLISYPIYKMSFKKLGVGAIISKPLIITPKHIEIGNYVLIQKGARLEAVSKYLQINYTPNIIIGDGVTIEQNIHLTCANSVNIGSNTAIAANVTITDINHPYIDITCAPDKQAIEVGFVIIGQDCKIYNNVVILPNTTLGNHTVVGANSVVLGKVYPDNCVITGSPAKIVKRYNNQTQTWQKTTAIGEFIGT